MANVVTISEFKATCLSLLDSVKKSGQPLLVTRRGEPIAQILPPPPPEKPKTWLGSFSTIGTIKGDIITPATGEDEWEAFRDATPS